VSDMGVEAELPDGPASSGDRMRESALLEAIMASRRVSAKVSSSNGAGSGPSWSVSSKSAACAFPFPLSVLPSFASSDLRGSFEIRRADERMAGASWKSDPSTQGINWSPELLVGSKIEDTIEVVGTKGNARLNERGSSAVGHWTASVSAKILEPYAPC